MVHPSPYMRLRYVMLQGSCYQSEQQVQKMYDFSRNKSRQSLMTKYVDKVFKKVFPSDLENITLKDLLEWSLWPIFISIHSMYKCNILSISLSYRGDSNFHTP